MTRVKGQPAMAGQADDKAYATCGARKKQGPGTCTRPAGWGTDHPGFGQCKLHGGSTQSGTKAAAERQAIAAVETYGLPREVAPHEALIEELHRTAGHVAWLGMMVRDLESDQLHGPVGGGLNSYPSEEPHVWLKLYQAERKHYAHVAKTCVDVGIAERQVALAEAQGQLIATIIVGVLRDLDIDPRSERARTIVRKHLTANVEQRELEAAA